MINFIQKGEDLTFTAPSAVTSGTPILIGSLLVVPAVTADSGATFVGRCVGVFEVTKVGSQAWTEGLKIYWDAGNTRFTSSSGGNTLVGSAVEAVGSGAGETTGKVRLDGVVR